MPYQPASGNPVAMPILTVHKGILTLRKMWLSLSPLTGQQYIILKNPDQYSASLPILGSRKHW